MSHPLYWIALQQALGVPSRRLNALLTLFGSPEGVFAASEAELARTPGITRREAAAILAKPYAAAKAVWASCRRHGITPITPEHPHFPERLRQLTDCPCVLYVQGSPELLTALPAISVVGTRKPTPYGLAVTRRIVAVLAAAGMLVVSGGALGIDAAAHTAALEVGGKTAAVLGCGLANDYLRANQKLRETIAATGVLLSEYPPAAPATRYSFPVRNRIIAALSLGTLVTEAGEKSGSLITAGCALELGRDVFALPGSALSPAFVGSNRLITDGAVPVFSGLDVLHYYENDPSCAFHMARAEELNRTLQQQVVTVADPQERPEGEQREKREEEKRQKKREKERNPAPPPPECQKNADERQKDLSEPARRVYNRILDAGGLPLDDIVRAAGLSSGEALRLLTELELEGLLQKEPTGLYRAV